MTLLTYDDVIKGLEDFANGYALGVPQTVLRRAVREAYRDIVSAHDWSCLYVPWRFYLYAAQTDGTVQYVASTRTLTLSGATWPAWAANGAVRIDMLSCDVQTRVSDTVLTLDAAMNAERDYAAGTSYRFYQRWIELPEDFMEMASRPHHEFSWQLGEYISPEDALSYDHYLNYTGTLRYYTIIPSPRTIGRAAVWIFPAPNQDKAVDIVYKHRPRELRHTGWDAGDFAGTVSTTAGTSTVTGSGTAFDASMIGSVIRLGTSATVRPTGLDGLTPAIEEQIISAVASTTSLTVKGTIANAVSAKKYVVSDPIDLDVAMHDAFLRSCERHVAGMRNFKERRLIEEAYQSALFTAKCADSKVGQRRIIGSGRVYVTRLADSPYVPEVS